MLKNQKKLKNIEIKQEKINYNLVLLFYRDVVCCFVNSTFETSNTYAKKIPKKFLANKSNILYIIFLIVYGSIDATPYNDHIPQKYQKVLIPSGENTA